MAIGVLGILSTHYMFHAVSITRRPRPDRFLTVRPTVRQLKEFRDNQVQDRGHGPREREGRQLHGWFGQYSAELIIAWVKTSQFAKQVKDNAEAAAAWAELFELCGGDNAREITSQLEHDSRQILRKARVRSDCAAMLL